MVAKRSTPLARRLRRNQTEVEQILWRHLRNRQMLGFKFRRQYPIKSYVTDFASLEAGLVIELDGGQHADRQVYDAERTRVLEACGFHVVRFWNRDVIETLDGVLVAIQAHLTALRSNPSPGASRPLLPLGEEKQR